MTFVEVLRSARQSSGAAYGNFVRNHSRVGVHIFLEGPDDVAFYTHFIELENHVPIDEIHHYKCGGKRGVYEAREKVTKYVLNHNLTARIIVLFFVDKDLSEILEEEYSVEPDVYITDYYSIENYLVSEDMLLRVINDFFHSKDDETLDTEEIRRKFQEELKRFHQLMTPIMAWVISARSHGDRPQLDNLDLSRIFAFSSDLEISMKFDELSKLIEHLAHSCNVSSLKCNVEDLNLIQVRLPIGEPKRFVRGKYELWFFIKFVKKLAECFHRNLSEFKLSFSDNLINDGTAVLILSPRLPIPDSLRQFLNGHLAEYEFKKPGTERPRPAG